MAGKLSKDYADTPQAAIRALMKCTTPDEVEAFMAGDKRKSIQKEATALISRMNHVSELPELQIDNPPGNPPSHCSR